MNTTEVTALLACCASFDNRKPNPEMVAAWTAAIGDLDFIAAREAVVAHYQASREWIMPADIRGKVRRERAARIATDEALELPPHDPDNTAEHIAALKAARLAAANGTPIAAEGLVRRSIRELVGPRRVNELDDEARATYAAALREQQAVARRLLTEKPNPTPDPAPVFACEHPGDDGPCGAPAPHLSADRRRPLCQGHAAGESQPEKETAR